jgi:hypothetical protein
LSCLIDYAPRFGRSLETKQGVIEQDVTKFKGNYPIVFFFVNQGQGLKMPFKSSKFVQTKAPKA